MLDADPPNVDGERDRAADDSRWPPCFRGDYSLARTFWKGGHPTESVNLNEAAREVIALSLGELQRNRVILRAEFADGLRRSTGDRVQLQQVILNLFLNASDAMSSVDDRRGSWSSEPNVTKAIVSPVRAGRGSGSRPSRPRQLFEAFYTTKSGGMEIGLSVSRSIIESHQGRLWAARNDGPGATFSFSIPCEPEAATAEQVVRRP